MVYVIEESLLNVYVHDTVVSVFDVPSAALIAVRAGLLGLNPKLASENVGSKMGVSTLQKRLLD